MAYFHCAWTQVCVENTRPAAWKVTYHQVGKHARLVVIVWTGNLIIMDYSPLCSAVTYVV